MLTEVRDFQDSPLLPAKIQWVSAKSWPAKIHRAGDYPHHEKKRILIFALLALVGVANVIAQAQVDRRRVTQEIMHDKLELAQRVLKGLALEDWRAPT